jgi:hypothetical protein
MQRSRCKVFDQLTKRAKPALRHPTADAFDLVEFARNIDLANLTPDDLELMAAAAFFGKQIRSLRDEVLSAVVTQFSRDDLLRLAVGTVNRTITLSRRQAAAELRSGIRKSGAGHASALMSKLIDTPEGGMSADDFATTAVDALPHWFALAGKSRDNAPRLSPKELRRLQAHTEKGVTIERSLRDLWQQVLWEPWDLTPTSLTPKSHDQAAMWAAWQHREDVRAHQLQQFDIAVGETHAAKAPVLMEVVTDTLQKPNGQIRIRFGRETGQIHTMFYQLMEVLESSYLAPFLAAQLPGISITLRQACLGWFGLISLARALTNPTSDWEFKRHSDLARLSFQMPRTMLVDCVGRSAGLSAPAAESLTKTFTCDPSDLSDAFAHGLWHRPLIQLPDSDHVLFAAGTLQTANVLYVVERLLHATGMAKKMENGSLGLEYEETVRQSLNTALAGNPLLNSISQVGRPIPKLGDNGEEIDLVVRIGSTVLVGEIKCFVRPADPIDRYNYLEKLDGAAAQAVRKARWLSDNRDALGASLGTTSLDLAALKLIPLVVVNNSAGSGLAIDGATVTDAPWLTLLLSSGSYGSGLKRDNTLGELRQRSTVLYSSSGQLQARLQSLLLEPPPLQKFVRAVEWISYKFPTESGVPLRIERPHLSEALMIQAEM